VQDYIPLNDSCSSITTAIICSFPELGLRMQLRFMASLPESRCGEIWGGIQNPPAAVAFSVSGRHRAAFPIRPIISSLSTCAMNPACRAWVACLHFLPFNSTLWPGQTFPASTFLVRLRGLGTHIPQVRWLEQFPHQKNFLLLRWKTPSRKRYSLRCKLTVLSTENKPIFLCTKLQ